MSPAHSLDPRGSHTPEKRTTSGRPKVWEEEIRIALRRAARPLTSTEIITAILGPPPDPAWNAVKSKLERAVSQGLLRRIGEAAHGQNRYRYVLSELQEEV